MEEKINGMLLSEAKEDHQNKSATGNSDDTKGVLEVQNVSAWYGKTLAIKNISMSIRSKAIMAIIGPSGCGKSTFIRCLNRMHEVSHGGRVEGCIMLDCRRKKPNRKPKPRRRRPNRPFPSSILQMYPIRRRPHKSRSHKPKLRNRRSSPPVRLSIFQRRRSRPIRQAERL